MLALLAMLAGCANVTTAPNSHHAGSGGASTVETSTAAGTTEDAGGKTAPVELLRCPGPNTNAVPTNTVIRIESLGPLNAATVTPESVRVTIDAKEIAGALEIGPYVLTFVPTDPLPAHQTVEVSITPEVLVDNGQPLAGTGGPWTFVTSDGPAAMTGYTFSAPETPPSGDGARSFALALHEDRPVLAWSAAEGLMATERTGTAFPSPVLLAPPTASEVSMALGMEKAHIGWTDFDADSIFYRRADEPLGSAVTAPWALSSASYSPRLAADATGRLAMAWQVDPEQWTGWGFRYSTSGDDGQTFSSPTMLDPDSQCADLAYVGEHLVLAWTAGAYGSQVLRIAASDDNGATFAPTLDVATSTTQFWCPRVVDRGDTALVRFEDGIGALATYVAAFDPKTNTIDQLVEIAGPDPTNRCSSIAASPSSGMAVIVRTHVAPPDGPFVTELSTTEDGGASWSASEPVNVLPSDQGCPEVALASSGDVHLAWTDSTSTLHWSRGRPKRPCD